MTRALKTWSYGILAASGLPALARRLARRRRLGILMYHGLTDAPLPVEDWCFVAESEFRWQIEWLARHFEMVTLEEGARRLRDGSLGRSGRPAVAITFDDGLACCHRLALPVLRQAGFPATVFQSTALVDSDKTFWHCRVLEAIGRTRREELRWDGLTFVLGTAEQKVIASEWLQARLKRQASQAQVAALEALERALDVPVNPSVAPDSPFRILSKAQMREMTASGLIDFGGHAHEHVILALLDEASQRREIETSVRRVAELAGRPCRTFAYPNGGPQDYDSRTLAILKESGVEVAVTAVHGSNAPGAPPLELRRFNVGANITREAFVLMNSHMKA